MAKTRDFAKAIRKQLAADPELRAEVEKHRLNFAIASLILEERTKAGLTQKELAELVGSHQSVIARLEDADYSGHSLSMLWRIADALKAELRLEFVRKSPVSFVRADVDELRGSVAVEIRYEAYKPKFNSYSSTAEA